MFCDSTELDMTVEIDTENYQIEIDFEYLEHGLNINSRLFSNVHTQHFSFKFSLYFIPLHRKALDSKNGVHTCFFCIRKNNIGNFKIVYSI